MTKFNKKTLLVVGVVATLAAAPIVFAATSNHMTDGTMSGAGQTEMMGQASAMGMGGGMGMGMGMGAGMTDENGNPIQMPAMTAEQLTFMRAQLDKMPDAQRALMETQLQEHGVTLPDAK
ncbi:MAG: hypothetical protein GXP05_02215 [Alphaproteobacteria bacterium]|nr:hypothetical protein [Alphaproteobacteria bacterium]